MKNSKKSSRAARDLKDMSHEVSHRVKAGAERTKRAVAGSAMTTTQKTKSALKEAGHRVAAGADKAKRNARDKGW